MDVVLHASGRREVPDRGHLLADRDRRPHDHPAAGRDAEHQHLLADALHWLARIQAAQQLRTAMEALAQRLGQAGVAERGQPGLAGHVSRHRRVGTGHILRGQRVDLQHRRLIGLQFLPGRGVEIARRLQRPKIGSEALHQMDTGTCRARTCAAACRRLGRRGSNRSTSKRKQSTGCAANANASSNTS